MVRFLIDDVDFMNYTKQEVRSNIGYVLQESQHYLVVRLNQILRLVLMLLMMKWKEYSEMIGAKNLLKDYPVGIHTKLEYLGSNLSTGEKTIDILCKNLY